MKWRVTVGTLALLVSGSVNCHGEHAEGLLWSLERPVSKLSEIPTLKGVRFQVIKKRERDVDGYRWLHGVALAWHEEKLYACFGHNRGSENSATEEANGLISTDDGTTWGPLFQIDNGDEPNLAVSHGVFLSHEGTLWSFLGSFYGNLQQPQTRAYVLNEKTGSWEKRGVVLRNGFWPMGEPQFMADGNWIMSGVQLGGPWGSPHNPPAVAISHGNDLTKWDLVVIPKDSELVIWGESGVIVEGKEIACISRGWHGSAWAYVSISRDYGRTWTRLKRSNLPMTTSKPYCGTLSTGQRYLVGTVAANIAGRNDRDGEARYPLTIAVSPPDGKHFTKIFRIRDDVFPDGPGESAKGAALSYPYTVEHKGKLYVGYSNDGGRGYNLNSAELAVIPLSELMVSREQE